jgi:hypothetical protein
MVNFNYKQGVLIKPNPPQEGDVGSKILIRRIKVWL